MIRHGIAYAFRTSFTLPEMLQRLDGVGGHNWIERDRDAWGDYLSSITTGPGEHDKIRLRILWPDDVDTWVLDVLFASAEPDADARWQGLLATARDTLVIVDASEIREVDDYSE
jgi:hypothetical protein